MIRVLPPSNLPSIPVRGITRNNHPHPLSIRYPWLPNCSLLPTSDRS
jgi:hypothetical protein